MHSNTTGFVVNALAAPHTQLKSQLRPIMVFPLQATAGWAATRPVHCGHKDVSSTVIQRNSGGPTNLIIIITDQNLSGRGVQTRMNGNKKKSFSGSSKWSNPGRLKDRLCVMQPIYFINVETEDLFVSDRSVLKSDGFRMCSFGNLLPGDTATRGRCFPEVCSDDSLLVWMQHTFQ